MKTLADSEECVRADKRLMRAGDDDPLFLGNADPAVRFAV